jgi:hypothetical protein
MHILPITEPLRQIPPGDAGTVAVKNRLNEQPVIRRRHPDVAFPPWQQVTDAVPLIIPKGIAAHGSTFESVDPLRITRFPPWESPRSPLQNLPSSARRAMREQAMLVNALWMSIRRS